MGVPGAMGGGLFYSGEIKKFSLFTNSKLFKKIKKSMKNLQFFEYKKEILRFFENFIEIFAKI